MSQIMHETKASRSATDPSEHKITLWKNIPLMLETGTVLFVLFLFAEALLGPLLTPNDSSNGSALLRLMWLPTYAIVFVIAALQWRQFVSVGWRMPVLAALLGLMALSVLWSINQELTLRRAFAAGMTTVFGLHLATRYNWRELLMLFGLVWFFLAILSYVVSLTMPMIGREQVEHVGAWRGPWFQKNALGGHMARSTFLFAFLILTEKELRRVWIAGLVLSLGLVLLSTSKTALLGTLLGFMVLGVGVMMRRGARRALVLVWGGVTFGGMAVAVFVFTPEIVFALLGRDATLTGRTDIWAALQYSIAERPWFGHGYGAFWAPGSAPAELVHDLVQWEAPTAHNGWLETWLSVGLAGLVLFTVSFLMTLGRAIGTAFSNIYGIFALGLLVQFFLFSLSESSILQQNSIVWLSYVSISAMLVREQMARAKARNRGFARRERDLMPVARSGRGEPYGAGQFL